MNGEVVWGQSFFERTFFSAALHWTVRLQQLGEIVEEASFEVHTQDFTIAQGDYLVMLFRGSKVIYRE